MEQLKKIQMKREEKTKKRSPVPEKPKLPKVFFQVTRERSANPAKTRLTTKQKEYYEKELKSEFHEKSLEIEVKLEKRKKCIFYYEINFSEILIVYESMGIFSGEKNKERVDAARFVAMSKE